MMNVKILTHYADCHRDIVMQNAMLTVVMINVIATTQTP
jgi:hypothetical protein